MYSIWKYGNEAACVFRGGPFPVLVIVVVENVAITIFDIEKASGARCGH